MKKLNHSINMKIDVCPISNTLDRIEFLDLGNIPLEGNLTETREESLSVKRYPMVLQFFPKTGLVSLTEHVEPDLIYENYLYHSGVSQPYKDHCALMLNYIQRFVKFNNDDCIVDIGGNDGTLLSEFKTLLQSSAKLEYINIEASKSFIAENKSKGISYFNTYWDEYICNEFFKKKPKLITTTNVFQHTAPIRSFVKGIQKNLDIDGVWCLEFPYFLTSLIKNCYDQAYHEHVYYYFLAPLKELFEQEGLRIINVSYHPIHDGTLRILSVKTKSQKVSDDSVDSFLNFEKDFMNTKYLEKWGKDITANIEDYKDYIQYLKEEGNSIAGFGAAIKGCVFLNSCELDYKSIDYVIDDTPEKQGKFIPGTGIQVVNRDILKTNQPDIILILAHNFKDWIINSLRKEGYTGEFLVMFPEIQLGF